MKEEVIMQIKDIQDQLSDSMSELSCSIAIENLFPDAKWPVRVGLRGGVGSGFKFVMTDSDDIEVVMELEDTPRCFLNRPVIREALDDIEKKFGRHTSKLQRTLREFRTVTGDY